MHSIYSYIIYHRYRDDLVTYLDESFFASEPTGIALGYKDLREKQDPLFLQHSRKFAELVKLYYKYNKSNTIVLASRLVLHVIFQLSCTQHTI